MMSPLLKPYIFFIVQLFKNTLLIYFPYRSFELYFLVLFSSVFCVCECMCLSICICFLYFCFDFFCFVFVCIVLFWFVCFYFVMLLLYAYLLHNEREFGCGVGWLGKREGSERRWDKGNHNQYIVWKIISNKLYMHSYQAHCFLKMILKKYRSMTEEVNP